MRRFLGGILVVDDAWSMIRFDLWSTATCVPFRACISEAVRDIGTGTRSSMIEAEGYMLR